MGTVDRYTDDLKVKLSSGKTLTLDADTVAFTGDVSISGALGNTTITGSLSVSSTATFSGSIVANGDITRAATLSITATGVSSDLTLTSGRDINLVGNDDINVTPTNDYDLTAGDEVNITSGTTCAVIAYSSLSLTGAFGLTQCAVNISSSGLFLSGTQDSTYVVDLLNRSTTVGSDVLMVRTLTESPSSSTRYATFASGAAQTTRGLIRGAATATSSAFYSEGTSGDSAAYGISPDNVEVNSTGDCAFVSGSADYGEFIECGDLSEWPVEVPEGDKYLGLPEGYIVYVRDKAFYKEGPGTPMVVSHRSIIVGNERVDEESVGQVMSFIGQVPVLVTGVVNSGDLLIPTGDFYAEAFSPDNITLAQYMRAIGTAWESSDKEDMKRVMCSVGVKNTY